MSVRLNRTCRLSAAVAFAVVVATGLVVGPAPVQAGEPNDQLDWSYLVEDGALPFFWGSGLVAAGALLFLTPPDTPRWFSATEGGQVPHSDTIPDYQIWILGAATPLLVALPATDARWRHTKGAAEAVMTVAAITELAKNLVGRHRPMYAEGSMAEDDRKSFFSGHSSVTLASTTYLGLYLHQHVFAGWREHGQRFAWWEAAPLGALAAAAVYIPYTRVADHRHHLSDVLVGAGVGSAVSVGFYWYQEHRAGNSRHRPGGLQLGLVPTGRGLAITGQW